MARLSRTRVTAHRQEGFTVLTIDNVARRAGAHKTSLYRNSKDRASLVAETLAENVAGGVRIPDTGSIETDLREYARALIGWLISPLGRAVLAATISDAARAEPEIAEIEQRFSIDRLRRAEPMVTRAIARGELPSSTDPNAVIKTVLAPIYLRLLITAEPVDEATLTRPRALRWLLRTPARSAQAKRHPLCFRRHVRKSRTPRDDIHVSAQREPAASDPVVAIYPVALPRFTATCCTSLCRAIPINQATFTFERALPTAATAARTSRLQILGPSRASAAWQQIAVTG